MIDIISDLLREVKEKAEFNDIYDDLTVKEATKIKSSLNDIYDGIHAGYLLGFLHGYEKKRRLSN